MITPDLISYLEKCEELGIRKEQTMSALLGAGWNFSQVQEGFKIMQARQQPMSKPKYVFPVFHLSLSLLFILMLGTGGVMVALNYVNTAPLVGRDALQANLAATKTPGPEDEAQILNKQINLISSVADALEAYKELAGRYPQALEDLRQNAKAIVPATSSTPSSSVDHNTAYLLGLYGERPIYEGDLTDLFSHSPLLYGSTGDDYTLSYLMEWKFLQAPTIEDEFINGWNTATKDTLSSAKHGAE